jgi:hypothetical protein
MLIERERNIDRINEFRLSIYVQMNKTVAIQHHPIVEQINSVVYQLEYLKQVLI